MPACYVAVLVDLSVSFYMKPVEEPELDLDDALWFAVVRVFTTKCSGFCLFLLTGFYISMESNCF